MHPLEASFAIKLALATCCPLCTPWPLGGQAGQAGGEEPRTKRPTRCKLGAGTTRTNSGAKMVAPTTEVVVVLNKPTAGTKLVRWPGPAALQSRCSRSCCACPVQGFIIESDYEGDDGHPRVGLIQPGTAANDVLVQGDIILSINGASVATHADAAKAIKAVKTGDVVIKVLTKKPRDTAPALAAKEASLEADAEQAAATKMQATIRGNAVRKEQAAAQESAADKVQNLGKAASDSTKEVFENIRTSVTGAATKVQEFVNPTSPRSSVAVEKAAAPGDEAQAATKVQAMLRGNSARKAMAANGETPAADPADAEPRKSLGERANAPASPEACTALRTRARPAGENVKDMLQRTGSALVEPFAVCTSPRKRSSLAVEGGLPKLASPAKA
jgi:hypothetical protein